MPNIKPFRDLSEHDVINLFSVAAPVPTTKGTFVVISSGWSSDQDPQQIIASYGAYTNTVSPRWGSPFKVVPVSTWAQVPLGMTLYDTRDVDENGIALQYSPHKQTEMQTVISGQNVPIATKGIFLYSGIVGGPITGGAPAYSGPAAGLYTTGVVQVGKFLGPLDGNGCALVKIDL